MEIRLQAALKENERYRIERKQFENVISKINNDEALQSTRQRLDDASSQPLDRDNLGVDQFDQNVLNENTITNTCRFSVKIHEEPKSFLDALLTDQTKDGKMLYQKVVEDQPANDVVY